MLRFITRFFAIIGFVVTLLILLGVGLGYYMAEKPEPKPDSIVLTLDFDEPIVEQNQPSPLDLAFHDQATPLLDLLRSIKRAKTDPHVKGIVARFGSSQPSITQAQEIRAALKDFRDSGKFTYAFGVSYGEFGMGNRAYYLASAFENIWLQPVGVVGLSGLAIQMPFAKTALANFGITADFLQREEYKSAMDNITRDDFAPLVKVETQAMIENLADQIASGIGESRKWDAGHVKQLMADGPYTDQDALKAGLVTRIGYADELKQEIDDKAGKDSTEVSAEDYLSYPQPNAPQPRAKVALIYGSGMIIDKADGSSDIPGQDKVMGADKIAGAFDDAADDKDIDVILFRIDSPGGSPGASETIRRAMMHAQKAGKTVIVSMGEYGASGGYWIAMNADRIVAEPGTLTGSIGVISGKFVLGGLMQKLGVNWSTLKTDDAAGMWSMTESFSPAQLTHMNALLDQTYATFTKNVAEARKIPPEKMPDIAKGRVWTGDQAIKVGLVDALGGFDVAMDEVHKKLKLGKDDMVELNVFPMPESTAEKVMKLLKNFGVESAALGPALSQWQKLGSTLGPLWRSAVAPQPVELRSPVLENAVIR